MLSAVSVDMVADLASKLNIKIQRQAPSWGWFTTAADKSKKLFAKNNADAYAKLQELWDQLQAPSKELQLWHCVDPRGLLQIAKGMQPTQLPALAVCAESRAAAIRMLDAHFKSGPGTDRHSMAYRVRKYWSKGWPVPMLAVKQVHGVWEISTQKKVA